MKDIEENNTNIGILQTELGIRVRLGEIFKETYVEIWLHTPNAAFNNKKPIEFIWENNPEPLYKMIAEIYQKES